MRVKPPKKKAAAPARKAKVKAKTKLPKPKASNRRKHRRHPTPNLWVTELRGDYQFVVPAINISEGGVFLKGRLKTDTSHARLSCCIPMGKGEMLEIEAKPVHDMIGDDTCGAGYQFVALSQTQSRLLRGFLRNLE